MLMSMKAGRLLRRVVGVVCRNPRWCGILTKHAPVSITLGLIYDTRTCKWCGTEAKIPRNGTDFFIDSLRGSDDNDGLSQGKAMRSLSKAMDASKANAEERERLFPLLESGNRIYVIGDEQ